MNLASRTPLFAFALAASLAAPLAFASPPTAQADTKADVQAGASAQAATPATPATPPTDGVAATSATPATPATPASASSNSGKMSWSDLDADKSGNLSKTEAQTVPALAALFDKADADTDGQLSGDEYRNYVSKSQGMGQDQGADDAKAGADAGTSADAGAMTDDGGKK